MAPCLIPSPESRSRSRASPVHRAVPFPPRGRRLLHHLLALHLHGDDHDRRHRDRRDAPSRTCARRCRTPSTAQCSPPPTSTRRWTPRRSSPTTSTRRAWVTCPTRSTWSRNTVGDTVVGRRVAISSEVAMKTYFMSMMGTPHHQRARDDRRHRGDQRDRGLPRARRFGLDGLEQQAPEHCRTRRRISSTRS